MEALYKGDDGGYNMIDTENNSIGTCHRPEKPQDVDCSMGTAAVFYQEFAICKFAARVVGCGCVLTFVGDTKATIKDSN